MLHAGWALLVQLSASHLHSSAASLREAPKAAGEAGRARFAAGTWCLPGSGTQGQCLALAHGPGAAGCGPQLVARASARPRKPCPSSISQCMGTNRDLEKRCSLVHTGRDSAAWAWGGGWTWRLAEVLLSDRPSHCMRRAKGQHSGCVPSAWCHCKALGDITAWKDTEG